MLKITHFMMLPAPRSTEDNFPSHGLTVLQVGAFWQTQDGLHVPFTKDCLPFGYQTSLIVEVLHGRFSSLNWTVGALTE